MGRLREYEKLAGKEALREIYELTDILKDKHILCINSTSQGGGVAEILKSTVFMINTLGIRLGWRTLHGSSDFFAVTKNIHNALQGDRKRISRKDKDLYYKTNERFSVFTHIDHDMVIIHDPQPLPLIDFYEKTQPWIFRCHVDLSRPYTPVWNYLKKFVDKYDHFVVSKEDYKQRLKMKQSVIYPAIDPFTSKNMKLSKKAIARNLRSRGIEMDMPIITQISRFDKWKDPLGVIRVFEKVREKAECQLVLSGSFSVDDPEGQRIFERVENKAQGSKYSDNIKLLLNTTDTMVNSLQTASDVVIQKSMQEGFGLVVSEALFKGTPVVASNVGGIPFQVLDGINGYVRDPRDTDGFVGCVLKLLREDNLRADMGRRAREHVINNFLVTRLISDWFVLMKEHFPDLKH
jgi:trehalose synthase